MEVQRSLLLRTCREPVRCCTHAARNSDMILARQVSVQQEVESNHSTPRRCQYTRSYLQTISLHHQFSSGHLHLYHQQTSFRLEHVEPTGIEPSAAPTLVHCNQPSNTICPDCWETVLVDLKSLSVGLQAFKYIRTQTISVLSESETGSISTNLLNIADSIYLQIIPQPQILLTSRHPSLDAFNVIISVAGL